MSYGGCEYGDLVDLPTYQSAAQQANAEGHHVDGGPAITVRPTARIRAPLSRRMAWRWTPRAAFRKSPRWRHRNSTNRGSPTGAARITRTARRRSHTFRRRCGTIPRPSGHCPPAAAAPARCFSSPSGKTGLGVPSDGMRDVPDVAFNASNAHGCHVTSIRTGPWNTLAEPPWPPLPGGDCHAAQPITWFPPAHRASPAWPNITPLCTAWRHLRRFSRCDRGQQCSGLRRRISQLQRGKQWAIARFRITTWPVV